MPSFPSTLSKSPATMSTTYGTIPTSPDDAAAAGSKVEFLSRATEHVQTGLNTRRPWKEMFNPHSINLPQAYLDTLSRIKTNFRYFLMNYIIIMLIILFLSLLWHPISLIVFVALMAAWLFLYFLRDDDQLVIFHHPVDDRIVMAVLSVVTIVLLLLTGATMNILCSVLVGVAVVVVHAVVRKTDDLCLDEDGGEAGGFLAVSSPVE